ncbi:hypothetical protein P7K49_026427, partial [Saguinus oedipus]
TPAQVLPLVILVGRFALHSCTPRGDRSERRLKKPWSTDSRSERETCNEKGELGNRYVKWRWA